MAGGVELAGDDTGREAGVGGEHLVGGDHREAVAEHHDDRALDPGQRRRQDDVIGHVGAVARQVVVPVDAEEVARVGGVLVDAVGERGVDRRRVGQLGEGGQDD